MEQRDRMPADRLIASLGDDFGALGQASARTFGTPPSGGADLDAERARIYDAQVAILDELCRVAATSIVGLRAKAACVADWAPELLRPAEDTWTARLLASVLTDLLNTPN